MLMMNALLTVLFGLVVVGIVWYGVCWMFDIVRTGTQEPR